MYKNLFMPHLHKKQEIYTYLVFVTSKMASVYWDKMNNDGQIVKWFSHIWNKIKIVTKIKPKFPPVRNRGSDSSTSSSGQEVFGLKTAISVKMWWLRISQNRIVLARVGEPETDDFLEVVNKRFLKHISWHFYSNHAQKTWYWAQGDNHKTTSTV